MSESDENVQHFVRCKAASCKRKHANNKTNKQDVTARDLRDSHERVRGQLVYSLLYRLNATAKALRNCYIVVPMAERPTEIRS